VEIPGLRLQEGDGRDDGKRLLGIANVPWDTNGAGREDDTKETHMYA
jgi:hypothetical protein